MRGTHRGNMFYHRSYGPLVLAHVCRANRYSKKVTVDAYYRSFKTAGIKIASKTEQIQVYFVTTSLVEKDTLL